MKRIHILRPGTFTDMNGTEVSFSADDLAATAAAYDPKVSEAPLVVGHPKHDAPAYGWVASLAADGEGLHALPHQEHPQFSEMVEGGSFKKISASLYPPDHPSNPKPGIWYVKHVGFLGAMPPAIKGLKQIELADDADCVTVELGGGDDLVDSLWQRLKSRIVAAFAETVASDAAAGGVSSVDASAASIEFAGWSADQRMKLAKGEIKGDFAGPGQTFPIADADDVGNAWNLAGRAKNPDAIRARIIQIAKAHGLTDALPDTARAWAKSHSIDLSENPMSDTKDFAERDAALKTREAEIAAREQALAAEEAKRRRTGTVAFVDGLVNEGKVLPHERALCVELIASLDPAKTVSFGEGTDAKDVKLADGLQQLLTGLPKRVDLGEFASGNVKHRVVNFSAPEGRDVDRTGLELHAKAESYQRQHNVDYVTACKAVGMH